MRGLLAMAMLPLAFGVAWAVVPPDYSVRVTDETGEPIPDLTITVEIPRKARKPKKVTRRMPRRPRRNEIGDNAKRIVKHPPRERDVTATFRVPRDADCHQPLKVRVRIGNRKLGKWHVPGWCADRDRLLSLRLAPSEYFMREVSGPGEGDQED